jgi:hypothetical protein
MAGAEGLVRLSGEVVVMSNQSTFLDLWRGRDEAMPGALERALKELGGVEKFACSWGSDGLDEEVDVRLEKMR